MPSTGLRGQGEQRHGLLFCFRPTTQRRVQFHAGHGSSAQFDALQGDFRDRGTRFVKPRRALAHSSSAKTEASCPYGGR